MVEFDDNVVETLVRRLPAQISWPSLSSTEYVNLAPLLLIAEPLVNLSSQRLFPLCWCCLCPAQQPVLKFNGPSYYVPDVTFYYQPSACYTAAFLLSSYKGPVCHLANMPLTEHRQGCGNLVIYSGDVRSGDGCDISPAWGNQTTTDWRDVELTLLLMYGAVNTRAASTSLHSDRKGRVF